MAREHGDQCPTAEACTSRVEKGARDRVRLDDHVAKATAELLGNTAVRMPFDDALEALKGRLKKLVSSLPTYSAVVLRELKGKGVFRAVLHVYPLDDRDRCIKVAQEMADCDPIRAVLSAALATRFRSENFKLPGGYEVSLAGYPIHNLGVVALRPLPMVVVFLNRGPKEAEKTNKPDAGVPWTNYTLENLYRGLVSLVSPLQLSHETFEAELPCLLKEHPGEWVAYHGERRVNVYPSYAAAIRACLEVEKIPGPELYIRVIEREPPPSFG